MPRKQRLCVETNITFVDGDTMFRRKYEKLILHQEGDKIYVGGSHESAEARNGSYEVTEANVTHEHRTHRDFLWRRCDFILVSYTAQRTGE
jgi:hypothetical protein